MDFQALIYIILFIGYVFYKVFQSLKERNQEAMRKLASPNAPKPPVSPPAYKPLTEILKEVKRKQEEMEAQKNARTYQQKTTQKPAPPKLKSKSVLSELKQAGENEGLENYESANVKRQAIADEKKEMQAIYDKQEETGAPYEFDARQAFIGSLIFERKY